ncbi:acyltransferase family protein [Humibacter albus]|uniref:acyltransferase family protein n=1 Tax=Humibacter albus TaxID=427754 RepID=UPI0003B622E2|nr:acyltransferase [Humibacter albus]
MSVDIRPLTPPLAPTRHRRRDVSVDLARAWCLVVVVCLHGLMVGVSVGAHGPVLQNALAGWPGFAALSWFVQIMPLVFVLGGFAAFTQWTSLQAKGATASDYVALRLRRLLGPAVVAIAAVVVTLAALSALGVPSAIVAIAGFHLGQPLWFLGVYIMVTSLAPVMVALHRRAPVVVLLALAAMAAGIDVVRALTGVTVVGFANLLFVWLLVQQFGFWLAQERMPRRRSRLALLAAASFGALALLCALGVFSFDMLAELNPPSCALVLLGVGQLALFTLLRRPLRWLHAVLVVGAVSAWMNARAMTIYLWHMLVLIALAGVLLIVRGAALPDPLSASWWVSRPIWLLVVVVAVAGAVWASARWERDTKREASRRGMAAGTSPASVVRVAAAAALGAGGVLVILVTGFTMAGGVLGLSGVAAALRLVTPSGSRGLVVSPPVRPAAG